TRAARPTRGPRPTKECRLARHGHARVAVAAARTRCCVALCGACSAQTDLVHSARRLNRAVLHIARKRARGSRSARREPVLARVTARVAWRIGHTFRARARAADTRR